MSESVFGGTRAALEKRRRPLIAGILNVTPDSFSDGGRFASPGAAVDAALRMADEGADLIDLGAVSTRPGAAPVSEEEERRRLLPVLEGLAGRLHRPLSIDTYRASILEEAVDRGAGILNDVTALRGDPRMAGTAARLGVGVILMHMQGNPLTMQKEPHYEDVVREVRSFLAERLEAAEAAGIAPEALVVDPGIGFGKDLRHNLDLLRGLGELRKLGRPIMLGASRKSFLGKLLERVDPAEREWGTAAVTAHAFCEGVELVRVHDVRAAHDLSRVLEEIRRPSERPET